MSAIIYLDSWMVILNKDAGEPVQTRDSAQTTIVEAARERLGDHGLQPVHRIDQPVSGLVILARSPSSFTALQEAIGRGDMRRVYLAVVTTPPEPAEGTLEDYLLPGATEEETESVDGPRARTGAATRTRVVAPGTTGSRESRLTYRTIGFTDHHTILLVELSTGRHHQIRAQLAERGWHVVGDTRYGARRPMRDRSIALHAWYISVPHPHLDQQIACTADLPVTALWRGVSRALDQSNQAL